MAYPFDDEEEDLTPDVAETPTAPVIPQVKPPAPPVASANPDSGLSPWEQDYLARLNALPDAAQQWRDKAAGELKSMQDEYADLKRGQKPGMGQVASDILNGVAEAYLASLPGRYATPLGLADSAKPALESFQQYQQFRNRRFTQQKQEQLDRLRAMQAYRQQMLGLDKDVMQANQQSQLEGAKFAMEARRRADEIARNERHFQIQTDLHRQALAQSAQSRQDMLDYRKALLDAKGKEEPWFKDNIVSNATSLHGADVKLNSQSGDFSKELDALEGLTKDYANRGALDQAADYIARNFKDAAPGWARALFGDKTTPEQQLSLLRTTLKGRLEAFKGMPGLNVDSLIEKVDKGTPVDVANAASYLNNVLKNSQNRYGQFIKNPKMNPYEYLNIPNAVQWEEMAPKADPTKTTKGKVEGAVDEAKKVLSDWTSGWSGGPMANSGPKISEGPAQDKLPAAVAPKQGSIKVPVIKDGKPVTVEMSPEEYTAWQNAQIKKILGGGK